MEEGGSRKRKNNTEHSYIARSIAQTNRRIREAWDKQNNEIIKSYTGSRRKKKLSLSHDDNHVDNNLMMVIDDDNNNNNENNIIEDHVTFNGDEEGIIHLLKEVNDHEIINVDHQINSSSSSTLPSTTTIVVNNYDESCVDDCCFNDLFSMDTSMVEKDKLFCQFSFNWKSFMLNHRNYSR